jgi:uncharacterized protein
MMGMSRPPDGFQFDSEKNQSNLAKHGRLLSDAELLWSDDFKEVALNVNSGEQVWLRAGYLPSDEDVWGVMFVYRGSEVRLLSFRRLNERERKKYGLD